MDKGNEGMMAVVEEVIAREQVAGFGFVRRRELAEKVLEAIRLQQIITFEHEMLKDAETIIGEYPF